MLASPPWMTASLAHSPHVPDFLGSLAVGSVTAMSSLGAGVRGALLGLPPPYPVCSALPELQDPSVLLIPKEKRTRRV